MPSAEAGHADDPLERRDLRRRAPGKQPPEAAERRANLNCADSSHAIGLLTEKYLGTAPRSRNDRSGVYRFG
jgi:hypothetical protein